MKNNRTCILCKTEYSYCGSGCRGDAAKPTWMKLYCCENCKDIFTALNDYNFGKINKVQAQEILSKCDISIELNEHYQNEINAIMAKPKRVSKPKQVVVEPEEVKEDTPVPSEE